MQQQAHRLCVAPMMDWTDRHDRFFLRLLSRHARLYTEMLTPGAVRHGDRARLLGFDPAEHPVALQLGGADPAEMAEAARIGEAFGYDEININVGCPSDRVQRGRFGACLMAEPETVAACVAAMRRAVAVPVTVKTRIGIDDRDSFDELLAFVDRIADAGCRTVIVHARKAWLKGLSPKQNREIPPLRHDVVHRLKACRPGLGIVINGGIGSLEEAVRHLAHVDGVMMGRAAYQTPFVLSGADQALFGAPAPPPTRHEAVEAFLPYVEARLAEGVRLPAMTRHILGLFQGCPGARAWRRSLAENAHRPGAGTDVIRVAAALAREAPDREGARAAA